MSHQDCREEIEQLRHDYEKQIFDLRQLIEISKSLNSTLDYSILMDAILYTCMGQMKVLKAGLFAKRELDHDYFSLHRNFKGFELENDIDYVIRENSALIQHLADNNRCCTLQELEEALPDSEEMQVLRTIDPMVVVPLWVKGHISGIIILGERIDGQNFSDEEKEYLLNIALFAAIAVHNAFLFEMTTTDMMTKLKLRHFFMASLIEHQEMSTRKGGELSLLILDIDHFKQLNDTYGHPFGDTVLKRVTAVIRDSIRQIDIAARYGGEEFVVLLPEANIEMACTVGERIRRCIADMRTMFEAKTPVGTTISIGAAQYDPERDKTSEALINRADKALYVSKQNGRNRLTVAE